ncbi:hypothetical protein SXCC_01612 [Gluconacetobacter sp. SXCC-1]|nr:hypothetical protein SXCC_01612 [Gluconacetobacter sp. SXCC-1]
MPPFFKAQRFLKLFEKSFTKNFYNLQAIAWGFRPRCGGLRRAA